MIIRKIERVFPESINHLFVAMEGNAIIGTGEISLIDESDTSPVMYGLFVKKSYRKQGIARKLIDVRIDFLAGEGYQCALCYIHPSNIVSINLIQSYGFEKLMHTEPTDQGSEWYKINLEPRGLSWNL